MPVNVYKTHWLRIARNSDDISIPIELKFQNAINIRLINI